MNAEEFDNVTPLARTAQPSDSPVTGIAIVHAADPRGGWRVERRGQRLHARRAASCLLEPSAGDRVWLVGEAGEHFISAVLERADPQAATELSVTGDLSLRSSTGKLDLAGARGVELSSPDHVGITSDVVRVQAREGQVVFGELRAIARQVHAALTRVTRVGEVLELLVDKVVQRSRYSHRVIEAIDHTQAGNIEYHAREVMHLHAHDALINGEQLVKVEGDQIHLG